MKFGITGFTKLLFGKSASHLAKAINGRSSFIMANAAKYTRAATGQLCQHYERKKDADGHYIKFGNQDIDLSKTVYNYNLAPHHEGGQINFIRQRTSEVKCLNRADVNVMCTWVVTLPKSFPSAHEREFFSETYRFLTKRYGEENVVSAYVHKDENQPHVHFAFIPVTIGKNGKKKVSAKEVLTKAELQAFHPELQRDLEQHFGFEVEILNGATKGGNKALQELKAEQLTEEYEHQIDSMTDDMLHTQDQIEDAHGELSNLQQQKDSVQKEIDGLKSRLLTERDVINLHGKKSLMGALKGISYDDYEALKRTAAKVESVEGERDQAIMRAISADKRASDADQRAKEVMKERPSLKLQMENAQLLGKLTRIERRLHDFMERLPAQVQVIIQNVLNDRDPYQKISDRGKNK